MSGGSHEGRPRTVLGHPCKLCLEDPKRDVLGQSNLAYINGKLQHSVKMLAGLSDLKVGIRQISFPSGQKSYSVSVGSCIKRKETSCYQLKTLPMFQLIASVFVMVSLDED